MPQHFHLFKNNPFMVLTGQPRRVSQPTPEPPASTSARKNPAGSPTALHADAGKGHHEPALEESWGQAQATPKSSHAGGSGGAGPSPGTGSVLVGTGSPTANPPARVWAGTLQ